MQRKYLLYGLFIGSMLYAGADDNKKNTGTVYTDAIADRINFEFVNKSPQSIALNTKALNTIGDVYLIDDARGERLQNPSGIKGVSNFIELKPKDILAAQINTTVPTTVNIKTQIIMTTSGTPYPSGREEEYKVSGGKTRYLSYDSSKKEGERLHPQTGPGLGIGKYVPNAIAQDRTVTGLLKRENVTKKEISMTLNKS